QPPLPLLAQPPPTLPLLDPPPLRILALQMPLPLLPPAHLHPTKPTPRLELLPRRQQRHLPLVHHVPSRRAVRVLQMLPQALLARKRVGALRRRVEREAVDPAVELGKVDWVAEGGEVEVVQGGEVHGEV